MDEHMKATYGTFLTSFLTPKYHDMMADQVASKFDTLIHSIIPPLTSTGFYSLYIYI